MELHKAIKEIIDSNGAEMITNPQITNFLLDYQAFKEKPATKLILRDVINAGYGESILALQNDKGWQIKLKQYQHEFIDSCGYKEDLAVYVFESLAYALGLNDGGNEEPTIKPNFNVDSFFDIPEVEVQQPTNTPQNAPQNGPDPTDLYTISLSFYNEGKYQQAKGFMEKALKLYPKSSAPSLYLKLMGDIHMQLAYFQDAIQYYNECFSRKALELKVSIDQLRIYFQNRVFDDYINCMFCYYYCLYNLKKMSDAQWLQFVKSEARFGLIDAIKYCADNGINPVEDHFDIYFVDRDKLKSGDYLYEDGSFAHEDSKSKDKIGRVYLTDTSDYEKSQGWTHGYIVADEHAKFLFNKNYCQWSTKNEDLPFPHTHYTVDDINHWNELKTIESEQFIIIDNYDEYPVFNAVHNIISPIPLNGTSGWFLPSIHTCKRLCHIISWTSSQADSEHAIFCIGRSFYLKKKTDRESVIPVAAF